MVTASAPPPLPADLNEGLKRLKTAAMRRLAPELLLTAKTQHWKPEEFLRTLGTPTATAVVRHRPSGLRSGWRGCWSSARGRVVDRQSPRSQLAEGTAVEDQRAAVGLGVDGVHSEENDLMIAGRQPVLHRALEPRRCPAKEHRARRGDLQVQPGEAVPLAGREGTTGVSLVLPQDADAQPGCRP